MNNNKDMPVNSFEGGSNNCMEPTQGETKREKAFWILYAQALPTSSGSFDEIAQTAIEAVNAGFKALDSE